MSGAPVGGGPWRPGGGLRDGAGATPGCVAASVVDRRRRSPRLGRDRVRDRWRGMAGPREQWREVLLLGGGACGGVGAGDLSPERQERGQLRGGARLERTWPHQRAVRIGLRFGRLCAALS